MRDESLRDEEVLAEERGPLGLIVLNRPEALNSLTIDMIRLVTYHLNRWKKDERIKAVFLTGAGKRAFCAGGDMKAVYQAGMAYRRGEISDRAATVFFGEEYMLNRLIYHYPKPIISFVNGISMGGGFGLSGPGAFSIVCENTLFAMPEVGIGFFPDVGSSFYLNRSPAKTGIYLALTGTRIRAADILYTKLATHFMPLDQKEDCIERLCSRLDGAGSLNDVRNAVSDVVNTSAEPPPEDGMLEQRSRGIAEAFGGKSLESILQALEKSSSGWAVEARNLISGRSPTSLKVTLAHLLQTEGADFDAVTRDDYVLAQHFIQGHDFYEGIRAVLIGKDNAPQWAPDSLEDVADDVVKGYFESTGYSLEDLAA